MNSVGCCNSRADEAALSAAENSKVSMYGRKAIIVTALLTAFVVACLCFAPPLADQGKLASSILLGAGGVASLSFLLTPLRKHSFSWATAIIGLIITCALFLPGVFGAYSASTAGYLFFVPAAGAIGLYLLKVCAKCCLNDCLRGKMLP